MPASGNKHTTAAGDEPPPTYVSGERVFGPPVGTFDIEWVARQIERETTASFAQAHTAVSAAWTHARRSGSLDAEALAGTAHASGASAAVSSAVADHVIAYCSAYGVDPSSR